MSQIIQTLHKDSNASKGFLVDQVRALLAKPRSTMSGLELDLVDLINFKNLNGMEQADLSKRLSKLKLLTRGDLNPKTAKTLGLDVSNHILHLSPSDLSGFNVCPMASKGCRAACLNGAGRGLFDGVQLPRLRKTLFFINMRQQFLMQLHIEIEKIEVKAAKVGQGVVVRLNGTSDLSFENYMILGSNIFDLHKNVQFYDYTKVFSRLAKLKAADIKNYYVIFSASETNHSDARSALGLGFNVAMVFNNIPTTYKGFEVINGDEHDMRFMDVGLGKIVGLRAKGPARRDDSGFVRILDTK